MKIIYDNGNNIKLYNIIIIKKNTITKIFFFFIIINIYFLLNNNCKEHFFDGQKKLSKLIYKKMENIKEVNINNNKEIINYNKSNIYISMAVDNNLIYPTLVSMISALENNNKNLLNYFLLLSYDFNIENIRIYESLKENYQLKIKYYIIPNIFKYFKKWDKNTYGIYYKLVIPFLFPELKRIIFIDGDTLIFKDILEFYELPFNDNYILGYPFHTPGSLDKFGINSTYYINGGVLLINIEKLINDNKHKVLLKFTYENCKGLDFLEQDSINYILSNKIGLLPLKYGIYLYGNITNFKIKYLKNIRVKLNLTEIENAIKDPSLVHLCCCNPKVWNKDTVHNEGVNNICKKYQIEFYYYANKTKYFQKIYNKYMK